MSYVISVIDQVLTLEAKVAADAKQLRTLAALHSGAAIIVEAIGSTARDHQAALQSQRERVIAPNHGELPVSLALSKLYASLSEAIAAYAVLHAVSHRAFDSQADGNTADLAEAHLRSYADLVQHLDVVISDVVVAELSAARIECSCQCPACGLGLCLCSPHGANTVRQAWRETETPAPDGGLRVRQPRSGSETHRAGLQADDQVVAIDATPISTDLDIAAVQGAIRAHASREEVTLVVRRGQDEEFTTILRRT